MPVVQLFLLEGRVPEMASRCHKAMARTVHEMLGAPRDMIRAVATDVSPSPWVAGQRTREEIDADPAARAIKAT